MKKVLATILCVLCLGSLIGCSTVVDKLEDRQEGLEERVNDPEFNEKAYSYADKAYDWLIKVFGGSNDEESGDETPTE